MPKLKIGILREGKVPIDRRVPFIPSQAREMIERHPEVDLVIQSSTVRCFPDDDYREEGLQIVDNVDDCDVLFGVKEVPIENLIPEKAYFFFSHTIKKQSYNKKLLQTIIKRKIRLIDYETLTDNKGNRIVAFGRWAGIVGAYNGIRTYGQRYNLFDLRKAHDCFDLEDLKFELRKVKLTPIKIVVTGGGRVSHGAMEVLKTLNIKQVEPADFLINSYQEPVFTQLDPNDYHIHKKGKAFELVEFFKSPENFESTFLPFTKKTNLLIAGAFWDPKAPVLFHREDMMTQDFTIKVIADITCDIEGSIPSTKKASTIDDPIYDYDAEKDKIEIALSNDNHVTVMAVDNLPCELPRDASKSFGHELLENVIPHLLGGDKKSIIERATITKDGHLLPNYNYLQDYIEN